MEDLIKAQNAQKYELGVKVVNILYNLEMGASYCILDTPHKEAVEKHHDKIGVKCDWIMEVKATQQAWGTYAILGLIYVALKLEYGLKVGRRSCLI